MTDFLDDCEQQVRKLLKSTSPEDVVIDGVRSMINGACDGLLINLGHSCLCDPAQSMAYGETAIRMGLEALKDQAERRSQVR